MPTFNLDSINYVVTGERQQIVNVDYSYGSETKNVSLFTDNEIGTYGKNLSANTTFSYYRDGSNKNQYGFVFLKDPNQVIRPLFDAKDIAFKSAVAEQIQARNNFQTVSTKENYDIPMYFPHLRKNPLGFVQIQDYGYGMSDKTVIGPVIKKTDLYLNVITNAISSDAYYNSFGNPSWNFYLNPYDKYDSNEKDPADSSDPNLIPIYLYTPLANLSSIVSKVLSADYATQLDIPELSSDALYAIECETIAYTSSYYAFLTFFKNKDSDMLSNLFKPVYNCQNVKHNYIFEIPLRTPENIDNAYSIACINADMIMAKNAYDDLYNVNTDSGKNFNRIRDYKTISTTGQKIFLTYFDDRQYQGTGGALSSTYEDYDAGFPQNVNESENEIAESEQQRDYMKIECIDAINRFTSTTMHKANLYSTRVYGLNALLDDKKYDSDMTDTYRNNIKYDIKNSIKRIVKNFMPAHTQYFDVVEFSVNKVNNETC